MGNGPFPRESLPSPELTWLRNKSGATRLGFAVLLKFFQYEARFPTEASEVPAAVLNYMAQQLGIEPARWLEYDWQGRSIKYARGEIRSQHGFREATVADADALGQWLCDGVCLANGQKTTLTPQSLKA